MDAKSQRPFLVLWTLAVAASVAAFVLHLALRGRTVELGYQLGRARGDQARLREVKRVLVLEAASYETPQRVEVVARTLASMQPPAAAGVVPVPGMAVSLPPAHRAPLPVSPGSSPGPTPAPTAGARAER